MLMPASAFSPSPLASTPSLSKSTSPRLTADLERSNGTQMDDDFKEAFTVAFGLVGMKKADEADQRRVAFLTCLELDAIRKRRATNVLSDEANWQAILAGHWN